LTSRIESPHHPGMDRRRFLLQPGRTMLVELIETIRR
jgi:hypothetical protein